MLGIMAAILASLHMQTADDPSINANEDWLPLFIWWRSQ